MEEKKFLKDLFETKFKKDHFVIFIKKLFKEINPENTIISPNIEKLGSVLYDNKRLDILVVKTDNGFIDRKFCSLRKLRSELIRYAMDYQCDYILSACFSPESENWILIFTKVLKNTIKNSSFRFGKNEPSYIAVKRFLPLIRN